jgi:hypothetical protein
MPTSPADAILRADQSARHSRSKAAASWSELPGAWRQRLAGYGIQSPAQWRRLTPVQRSKLFGITTEMIRAIDAAVRGAPCA